MGIFSCITRMGRKCTHNPLIIRRMQREIWKTGRKRKRWCDYASKRRIGDVTWGHEPMQPPETAKEKEIDSLLESPEQGQLLQHLDFGPVRSTVDFWPSVSERTNFYCSMPPGCGNLLEFSQETTLQRKKLLQEVKSLHAWVISCTL